MKHATCLNDLNLGSYIALRDQKEVNDRPWISRREAISWQAGVDNRDLELRQRCHQISLTTSLAV